MAAPRSDHGNGRAIMVCGRRSRSGAILVGMAAAGPVRIAERYAVYDEIGAGGMATVHLARVSGGAGFARTVAVKRLHAHLAKEPDFIEMFVDEARLASRVRHPNVVPTLDVVATPEDL